MTRLFFCVVFLLSSIILGTVPGMAQIPPVLDHPGYASLLEKNRGKVVVVDFWASWCSPCRKKIAELNICRKSLPEESLMMIGISLDFNPEALVRFMADNPLNYPVYWAEDTLATQLEVHTVPLLFIYDRQGRMVHAEEGLSLDGGICRIINRQLVP